MRNSKSNYWSNISITIKTLVKGLRTTARHFVKATSSRKPIGITKSSYFKQKDGLSTLQYPHESFSIPDNGRYRLHNEMDDCIVCDKCVKICPVDCIEIDAIRATEEIGKTSDGTPKRIHGARFDIDMSKCCFCGLCTTVCPTESLTMTKSYDFSEYDVRDHTYAYATMTPLEVLEKTKALEQHNKEKEAQKPITPTSGSGAVKPVFKPKMSTQPKTGGQSEETKKPARPIFKPRVQPKKEDNSSDEKGDEEGP